MLNKDLATLLNAMLASGPWAGLDQFTNALVFRLREANEPASAALTDEEWHGAHPTLLRGDGEWLGLPRHAINAILAQRTTRPTPEPAQKPSPAEADSDAELVRNMVREYVRASSHPALPEPRTQTGMTASLAVARQHFEARITAAKADAKEMFVRGDLWKERAETARAQIAELRTRAEAAEGKLEAALAPLTDKEWLDIVKNSPKGILHFEYDNTRAAIESVLANRCAPPVKALSPEEKLVERIWGVVGRFIPNDHHRIDVKRDLIAELRAGEVKADKEARNG